MLNPDDDARVLNPDDDDAMLNPDDDAVPNPDDGAALNPDNKSHQDHHQGRHETSFNLCRW